MEKYELTITRKCCKTCSCEGITQNYILEFNDLIYHKDKKLICVYDDKNQLIENEITKSLSLNEFDIYKVEDELGNIIMF